MIFWFSPHKHYYIHYLSNHQVSEVTLFDFEKWFFSRVAFLKDPNCLDILWFILSVFLGFPVVSGTFEDKVSQKN